ncbi:MAG: sulfatase-like hydrolase/transferase, partial [Devosia sp.]
MTRPNILLVCTDQQRTDTLSCYGSTFTQTPGFDRVAQQGTRFNRAYCPSAVCTPSRASMMTG